MHWYLNICSIFQTRFIPLNHLLPKKLHMLQNYRLFTLKTLNISFRLLFCLWYLSVQIKKVAILSVFYPLILKLFYLLLLLLGGDLLNNMDHSYILWLSFGCCCWFLLFEGRYPGLLLLIGIWIKIGLLTNNWDWWLYHAALTIVYLTTVATCSFLWD